MPLSPDNDTNKDGSLISVGCGVWLGSDFNPTKNE